VFLDVDLFATRKAALELLSQTSRGRKSPNQLQASLGQPISTALVGGNRRSNVSIPASYGGATVGIGQQNRRIGEAALLEILRTADLGATEGQTTPQPRHIRTVGAILPNGIFCIHRRKLCSENHNFGKGVVDF
jgi:hypothetical protein